MRRAAPFVIGLLIGFGLLLAVPAGTRLLIAIDTAGCGDTPRAECMERNIR